MEINNDNDLRTYYQLLSKLITDFSAGYVDKDQNKERDTKDGNGCREISNLDVMGYNLISKPGVCSPKKNHQEHEARLLCGIISEHVNKSRDVPAERNRR